MSQAQLPTKPRRRVNDDANSIAFSSIAKYSGTYIDQNFTAPECQDGEPMDIVDVENHPELTDDQPGEDRYNLLAAKHGLNHDDVQDQEGYVDEEPVRALPLVPHYNPMVDVTDLQDDVTPMLHVPIAENLWSGINRAWLWRNGYKGKSDVRKIERIKLRRRGNKRTNNQHFKYESSFLLG